MYYDCYVLSNKRTKAFAYDYLNTFLPHREETQEVYELPYFGLEVKHEFETVDKLIDYLVTNSTEPYSIYWHNRDHSIDIHGINLHFTDDGHLILGLACPMDEKRAEAYLEKLRAFCSEQNGYYTFEYPPPLNSKEFLEWTGPSFD